jgi:hypothetical protein
MTRPTASTMSAALLPFYHLSLLHHRFNTYSWTNYWGRLGVLAFYLLPWGLYYYFLIYLSFFGLLPYCTDEMRRMRRRGSTRWS